MAFFIREEHIRPGNRGGRDQFKWDDIRLLNNKDRESYLGATQSIGFLDKGGKWRKRYWWLDYHPSNEINNLEVKSEIDLIKQEEERIINEALNPQLKNKQININKEPIINKLTEYDKKEIFKKEANLKPNDDKLYQFYEEDDNRKAGLGMKQNISFKQFSNNDKLENKLDGINANNFEEKRNKILPKNSSKNETVSKHIRNYMKEKNSTKKSKSRSHSKDNKHKHRHKDKYRHRSRSRNKN